MRSSLVLLCLAGLGGAAHAEDFRVPPTGSTVPRVLYIDRCPMDCVITAGAVDDARTDTSSLIADDATLVRMPRLDLVWADIVLCLGQVFGPYDLEIATEEPDPGTDYIEIKIAGGAGDLGLGSPDTGAGPIATDCSPLDHGLGFAFSNHFDLVEFPTEGAAELCEAVAHQAAHMLGLEHTELCLDLMGAAGACHGRRWFNDFEDDCVECQCDVSRQSSHDALLTLLGAGPDQPPPRVEVQAPGDGASVDEDFRVAALVYQGRPLETIELYVDDRVFQTPHHVIEVDGTGTGRYTLQSSDDGFDGYHHVEVVAFDDLGRAGGDALDVQVHRGTCAAAGNAAPWPLLLALALLLSRRRRSCSRGEGWRRAPRRWRRRAPAPPRAA